MIIKLIYDAYLNRLKFMVIIAGDGKQENFDEC